MKANDKTVKTLFKIRVALWIAALIATIYWIYWSFELYNLGFKDEHEYAVALRPYFWPALGISIVFLVISMVLRKISDSIKEKLKKDYFEY